MARIGQLVKVKTYHLCIAGLSLTASGVVFLVRGPLARDSDHRRINSQGTNQRIRGKNTTQLLKIHLSLLENSS